MRVYIAQVLCPNRHCIIGVAKEYETEEEAQELLAEAHNRHQTMLRTRMINDYCGICLSKTVVIELGLLKAKTMEEAEPVLKELERRQAATAAFFKASKQ